MRPAWLARALLVLGPALAYALARATGPEGAAGAFRAGLGALGASVVAGSLLGLRRGAWWGDWLGVACAAALPAWFEGLGWAGGRAAFLLAGSCALASLGLTRLGLAVGAGTVGGAGVGALVLVAAMSALAWADPLAAGLPVARRHAFRQAALDLDPATAWAYAVSGFDRLHHPPIYAGVPLASSFHERPQAPRTAVLWAALGALALLGARGVAGSGRTIRA